MRPADWLELVQLAETICTPVLLDLPNLIEADARGVLLWLRNLQNAKEGMA